MRIYSLLLALALLPAPALADKPQPPPAPGAPAAPAEPGEPAEPGAEGATAEGGGLGLHPVAGPMQEKLGHDIELNLPAGYMFFDAPQAKKLAAAMGNVPDDSLLGIIAPQPTPEQAESGKGGANWFVELSFVEEGYVKDDDKIDADAILDSIREGTEEANKVRAERGFKPIHVDGWAEAPRYEKAEHHLVWAVKGSDADGSIINFNTRILGRRGVTSLNLVCSPDELPSAKPNIVTLLAATKYGPGARYEDFQPKSDKVAEYGLAALVAGAAGAGALKLVKVGLLAKFAAPILKFLAVAWKFVLLALVAMGGMIRKALGLKPKETATTTAASDAVPGAGAGLGEVKHQDGLSDTGPGPGDPSGGPPAGA